MSMMKKKAPKKKRRNVDIDRSRPAVRMPKPKMPKPTKIGSISKRS